MAYYLSVLAFGIFYLVSMGGWGTIFSKIFRIGQRGFGLSACWGLAFSIVIGGVLNALHGVLRPVLLAYLGIGFLAALIFRFRHRGHADSMSPGTRLGLILLLAIVAIRYTNAAAYIGYDRYDDHGAYFVFPVKMLETGTLGQDPFSERRLGTSIGGWYFLQALLLAGVKPQNLGLLDHGIALLLLTSLIFDMMRDHRANWPQRLVLLTVAAFAVLPRANTSSALLSCCMFVALYRACLIARDDSVGWLRAAVLVALTFTGTISLKNTMLPPAGLYVLLFFGQWFFFSANRLAILATALATAGFALLFLMPWMLDMRHSGGTLWFPILGKGFHAPPYSPFPMPGDAVQLAALPAVLRLAFIGLVSFVPLMFLGVLTWRRDFRSDSYAVSLAVLVGACALSVATGGVAIQRQTAPFLLAACIICIAETIDIPRADDPAHGSSRRIAPLRLFPVLCAGLILGDSYRSIRLGIAPGIADIRSFSHGQIGADEPRWNRYRAAQSTVPIGATILTSLDEPYHLDFRRNTVLIADLPTVSPPPGMPRFQGPEALAAYLLRLNIRYVAYSYATGAGYRLEDFQADLAANSHPWIRGQLVAIFDLHNGLDSLGQTRLKLYDDGEIFVLDLARPR